MAQQAATIQREKGFDLPALDAKAEALARVEAATLLVTDMEARLRSNRHLRKALKAWRKGDAAVAAKGALAATEADEENAAAYHLLAIALEKLGHPHKALVTYQKAFELDPEDADLMLNLGLTALNLRNLEGACSMFRRFIEKRPDHPAGYNNLGSTLRDLGRPTEAIDTLRNAIYRMPEEPMLWNALATVLAEEGRSDESLVFYQEALRLDPNYARVWHNLGYAYMHLGRYDDALAAYESALTHEVHPAHVMEARHSRSICLISMGRTEEGFAEYEIRHAPDFRTSLLHYTTAPQWKGEPLDGKRIVMVGEQGLGDEIMFANTLPDMQRAVGESGKLQIAVDVRLIPLFQRSFPKAEVGFYEDRTYEGRHLRIYPWAVKDGQPDFYSLFGTPLVHFRKRVEDFPKEAFLVADPERRAQYRARLETLGPGPYVGVCWRSMVMDTNRRKYFSPMEMWRSVLTVPNVTFVNLQYGDCKAELAAFREQLGVTIHAFDDLNLKDDLDGAAALTDACDLVLSAPTSAAALAGALGKPVWFLLAGNVWPQLGTDHYPWYRNSRVFTCEKFADWGKLMPQVRDALAAFARC
jgi:tetratricopeptide (TPR) repeat protein